VRYVRHVPEGLLRDLVAAYRGHAPSAVSVAIEKIEAELKDMDAEDAKERADEERKKHPPLTVQKVTGVLRKAKLHMAMKQHGLAAVGGSTGFEVTYGDWEFHSWVQVYYAFAWDWGHFKGWSKEREAAEEKAEQKRQLDAAVAALKAAGLHVEPDKKMGSRETLKVTP